MPLPSEPPSGPTRTKRLRLKATKSKAKAKDPALRMNQALIAQSKQGDSTPKQTPLKGWDQTPAESPPVYDEGELVHLGTQQRWVFLGFDSSNRYVRSLSKMELLSLERGIKLFLDNPFTSFRPLCAELKNAESVADCMRIVERDANIARKVAGRLKNNELGGITDTQAAAAAAAATVSSKKSPMNKTDPSASAATDDAAAAVVAADADTDAVPAVAVDDEAKEPRKQSKKSEKGGSTLVSKEEKIEYALLELDDMHQKGLLQHSGHPRTDVILEQVKQAVKGQTVKRQVHNCIELGRQKVFHPGNLPTYLQPCWKLLKEMMNQWFALPFLYSKTRQKIRGLEEVEKRLQNTGLFYKCKDQRLISDDILFKSWNRQANEQNQKYRHNHEELLDEMDDSLDNKGKDSGKRKVPAVIYETVDDFAWDCREVWHAIYAQFVWRRGEDAVAIGFSKAFCLGKGFDYEMDDFASGGRTELENLLASQNNCIGGHRLSSSASSSSASGSSAAVLDLCSPSPPMMPGFSDDKKESGGSSSSIDEWSLQSQVREQLKRVLYERHYGQYNDFGMDTIAGYSHLQLDSSSDDEDYATEMGNNNQWYIDSEEEETDFSGAHSMSRPGVSSDELMTTEKKSAPLQFGSQEMRGHHGRSSVGRSSESNTRDQIDDLLQKSKKNNLWSSRNLLYCARLLDDWFEMRMCHISRRIPAYQRARLYRYVAESEEDRFRRVLTNVFNIPSNCFKLESILETRADRMEAWRLDQMTAIKNQKRNTTDSINNDVSKLTVQIDNNDAVQNDEKDALKLSSKSRPAMRLDPGHVKLDVAALAARRNAEASAAASSAQSSSSLSSTSAAKSSSSKKGKSTQKLKLNLSKSKSKRRAAGASSGASRKPLKEDQVIECYAHFLFCYEHIDFFKGLEVPTKRCTFAQFIEDVIRLFKDHSTRSKNHIPRPNTAEYNDLCRSLCQQNNVSLLPISKQNAIYDELSFVVSKWLLKEPAKPQAPGQSTPAVIRGQPLNEKEHHRRLQSLRLCISRATQIRNKQLGKPTSLPSEVKKAMQDKERRLRNQQRKSSKSSSSSSSTRSVSTSLKQRSKHSSSSHTSSSSKSGSSKKRRDSSSKSRDDSKRSRKVSSSSSKRKKGSHSQSPSPAMNNSRHSSSSSSSRKKHAPLIPAAVDMIIPEPASMIRDLTSTIGDFDLNMDDDDFDMELSFSDPKSTTDAPNSTSQATSNPTSTSSSSSSSSSSSTAAQSTSLAKSMNSTVC